MRRQDYFVVLTVQYSNGTGVDVVTDATLERNSSGMTRTELFARALDRLAASHQAKTGKRFHRDHYSVIFFSAEPNEVESR